MSEFLPDEYVRTARARFHTPPEDFAARVVLRLQSVTAPVVVWDYIPAFARPMIMGVVALLLLIVGIEMSNPGQPPLGVVDAYLRVDSTPAENWLYRDAELPAGHDLLLEISLSTEVSR